MSKKTRKILPFMKMKSYICEINSRKTVLALVTRYIHSQNDSTITHIFYKFKLPLFKIKTYQLNYYEKDNIEFESEDILLLIHFQYLCNEYLIWTIIWIYSDIKRDCDGSKPVT